MEAINMLCAHNINTWWTRNEHLDFKKAFNLRFLLFFSLTTKPGLYFTSYGQNVMEYFELSNCSWNECVSIH